MNKSNGSNANGNYRNQTAQGYIINALAVGMLPDQCIEQKYLGVRRITEAQFNQVRLEGLAEPAIGNRVFAQALDLPCRPQRVELRPGVKNYLAQYRGPRLNGSDQLPQGGRFEFYELVVLDFDALTRPIEVEDDGE